MLDSVVMIRQNGMGQAEETLQLKLMGKYLELLAQNDELPAALCFYTEGVKLVCEGSPVLETLRVLETKGTRLIICSTCLDYYKLTDRVKIGIVGGMPDIIEAQMKAAKVITL